MNTLKGFARYALFLLAGAGLVGRVFIPAGFMPAPVAEGWPVKLCPSVVGVSEGRHQSHAGDHDTGHHGGEGHVAASHHDARESDERNTQHNPCPLGALFASAALVENGDSLFYAPELGSLARGAESPAFSSTPAVGFNPRGPPSSSLDA